MTICTASRVRGVAQTSRSVVRGRARSSFRGARQASTPEIASPADVGVDLSAATPEVLVVALDDPELCEQAQSEINERLARTPKANQCALRFLRGWARERSRLPTAQEQADLADAWDGLERICFKAIGDRWLPGDPPPVMLNEETGRLVRTERALTRFFIEERIWDFLLSFRERSERDLLLFALKREFSHLPRAIVCDLIDEIRKAYADNRVVLLSLDSEVQEDATSSSPHEAPDEREALGLLNLKKSELIDAIGTRSYETLVAVADSATPDDLPDSRQARKSSVTAAIARKRAISVRQARTQKHNLYASLHDAQKRGVPIVRALYQTLRVPQDPEDQSESVLTTDQNDTEASGETALATAVLDEICE